MIRKTLALQLLLAFAARADALPIIGNDSALYNLNVPEPGTSGLLLLALAVALVLRHRARNR